MSKTNHALKSLKQRNSKTKGRMIKEEAIRWLDSTREKSLNMTVDQRRYRRGKAATLLKDKGRSWYA